MTVYTLSERVYDSPNDRAIVVSARAQGVVNPCDAPDEKNIIMRDFKVKKYTGCKA